VVKHYWATPFNAGSLMDQKIVVAETDNNTIVVEGDELVRLVTYTSGDHFQIGEDPVTLAAFEKALSADDTLTAHIRSDADGFTPDVFNIEDKDAMTSGGGDMMNGNGM